MMRGPLVCRIPRTHALINLLPKMADEMRSMQIVYTLKILRAFALKILSWLKSFSAVGQIKITNIIK